MGMKIPLTLFPQWSLVFDESDVQEETGEDLAASIFVMFAKEGHRVPFRLEVNVTRAKDGSLSVLCKTPELTEYGTYHLTVLYRDSQIFTKSLQVQEPTGT